MTYIKNEDIIGYRVGEDTVCPDCIKKEELDEIGLDDIIANNDREEGIYFCDRCKKQI